MHARLCAGNPPSAATLRPRAHVAVTTTLDHFTLRELHVGHPCVHVTPLHIACELGRVHLVNQLLRAGARMSVPNERGELPIHVAARCNHADCVHALIAAGCSVNATEVSSGRFIRNGTPLGAAARTGAFAALDALLARGANVHAVFCMADAAPTMTALHAAAGAGHVDCVIALLRAGAMLDTRAAAQCSWSPLHTAAVHGHVDVISLLCEHDPVSVWRQGERSPVELAARRGHVAALLTLFNYMQRTPCSALEEHGTRSTFALEMQACMSAALTSGRMELVLVLACLNVCFAVYDDDDFIPSGRADEPPIARIRVRVDDSNDADTLRREELQRLKRSGIALYGALMCTRDMPFVTYLVGDDPLRSFALRRVLNVVSLAMRAKCDATWLTMRDGAAEGSELASRMDHEHVLCFWALKRRSHALWLRRALLRRQARAARKHAYRARAMEQVGRR